LFHFIQISVLFFFFIEELQFEECPKWQALKDILLEIEEDSQTLSTADSNVCRVLVTAQDDNMCAQIKEVNNIATFSFL
jgi:hypothetical protein